MLVTAAEAGGQREAPREKQRQRDLGAPGEEERDLAIERALGRRGWRERARERKIKGDGDRKSKERQRNSEADLIKTKRRHGSCLGTGCHSLPWRPERGPQFQ